MNQQEFTELLDRFAGAVAAHDTPAFVALFAEDGVYDDHFFGPHAGREAIGRMLDRFFIGGERFCWQFVEPACGGDIGYSRYCFSYLSREPESAGQVVVFEGMARFRLRGRLIGHYTEVFDRGIAFTQLGYVAARKLKLIDRYTRAFIDGPLVRAHLEFRSAHTPSAPAP